MMISAVISGNGTASGHFDKRSTISNTYLFPFIDYGNFKMSTPTIYQDESGMGNGFKGDTNFALDLR